MKKSQNWLDYFSSKINAQISIDNASRAQSWAFALLSVGALGFALEGLKEIRSESFIYSTKILFLIFFHLFAVLGFYLPMFLQKGEKPVARLLGVRDLTSFSFISLPLVSYAVIIVLLSQQLVAGAKQAAEVTAFFGLVTWLNLVTAFLYLAGSVFYLATLTFLPGSWAKLAERGKSTFYVFMGLHVLFTVLLSFGYSEIVPMGSVDFFLQFRVVAFFWVFIVGSTLFPGKALAQSPVGSLQNVEFELAAGRLNDEEDVLTRFRDAYVGSRLAAWLKRLTIALIDNSHEIGQFTREAVKLVGQDKLQEIDLRKVEDFYKKADQSYRRLEKACQRFLLSVSLFDLNEMEREKIEILRDHYSRELRNAKLELATVRRGIDDTLLVLKNTSRERFTEISVEKRALSEPQPALLPQSKNS